MSSWTYVVIQKKRFIEAQRGVVDGHDLLEPIVPNTWCVCVCVYVFL
jgi:hypothetical protein